MALEQPQQQTERECGGCTYCCKLMEITALKKPPFKWCAHCDVGRGCKVYASKPIECTTFQCGWLSNTSLGDEWRPDRAKFVLFADTEGARLVVDCDPATPMAWQHPRYADQIREWAAMAEATGNQCVVCVGERLYFLTADRTIDLGRIRRTHKIAAMWNSITRRYGNVEAIPL